MNWINRVMQVCIRGYLSVVFFTVVTFFTFLRKLFGRSPIKISRRKEQTSYWVRRNDSRKSGASPGHPLIASQSRHEGILGTCMKTFLKERKYDYAFILALLLPVKVFLKVDKSTEVDPSIYVMY